MTEQDIEIYDDFIRANRLAEKTTMPMEKIREKVERAMTANNFAFIMADVVNSFMLDCDSALSHFDKAFSMKSKECFKNMYKHIVAARKWSEKLSQPVYECSRTDDMCADSDWWLAVIKLIDDRVAGNPQRTTMLLEFLLNMPEGESTYKVKPEDFKVFKP